MITLQDYWRGRDALYPLAMTPEIESNAWKLLGLVNALLAMYGGHPHVSSGWRPPAVNQSTPNAAVNSKHMTGQAIDLADPDGMLDEWLTSDVGLDAMQTIGLWAEAPAFTKNWCHLQSVPPKSGRRIFNP